MVLKVCTAIVLLAAMAIPSFASEKAATVGTVAEDCRVAASQRNLSGFSSGNCMGFIVGIMHMNELFFSSLPVSKRMCPPDAVSGMQAVRVFLKWADANPEQHHQPGVIGVQESLKTAFPCPSRLGGG